MSAGHSQPQVLYAVNNIRAYHVQNGEEHEITTSGPQTLKLLMVPTSSPFADLSATEPTSSAPEEDFYLHLQLPPELDLPLPASTQIYHKPPSSYLVPRWELGPGSGAFFRIEFPSIGHGPGKVTQDDVDTFETILAQCTAFLERASPPTPSGKAYNPMDYKSGEGYVSSTGNGRPQHGQIVLIDEENGSVVGELQGGMQVVENANVKPGFKTPVEIQLPEEGKGNQITVNSVSEEYLAMSRHPAYAKSTVVQTSAKASRLIVTTGSFLANKLTTGAESFQKNTKPNPTPMTFSPAAHERIRKIHSLTEGAVGMSAKTVGQFSRYAQNFGAKMSGKGEKTRGHDKSGSPDPNYKPGFLNKSMIAFSTIADGIDHAGRQLLASGSAAATNVVGHKYGAEAGHVASNVGGGVRNVGLVYIDAAGVSRRALIKSVAKGMVVGKMPNGQQLVVGAGDGGVVPSDAYQAESQTSSYYASGASPGHEKPGYGVEGYGNAANAPPSYSSSSLGEPAGSRPQGKQFPMGR